jgi:uncharacterized protein
MKLTNQLTLCFALVLAGCAGYVDQTSRIRADLNAGSTQAALASVNAQLGIEKLTDDPTPDAKNRILLTLERATLLQALESNKQSAASFQSVDDQLEVNDLTQDTLGSIAEFIYSGDSKVYKAAPFEKLLLNSLNMLNYMVMGKSNGAKIEARRFDINRNYLADKGSSAPSVQAFGSYLAGLAFEQAGEPNKAMRFYGDAYQTASSPELETTVRLLHHRTGATDPRLSKVLNGPKTTRSETGELVVVVQEGLIPRRVAERLPLGAAVTRVSADPHYRYNMSRKERAQANRIAVKGLVTWVNFPSLKAPRERTPIVNVSVAGQSHQPALSLNLRSVAIDYFKRSQGKIIAAAITRTISRAIAGMATEAITESKAGGPLGFLLGVVVQGTLTAADTPDTRGWVTLPARVHHLRIPLSEGVHTVRVRVGSRLYKKTVKIKTNQITVINLSRHRAG